jgi:hypothetical protein
MNRTILVDRAEAVQFHMIAAACAEVLAVTLPPGDSWGDHAAQVAAAYYAEAQQLALWRAGNSFLIPAREPVAHLRLLLPV